MRYTPSRWPRYLVLVGMLVASVLVLLHVAAGPVLRAQVEQALHPQPGQGTYLGDVSVNLFSGLLSVQGVVLGERDAPYFEAASLVIDLDMRALISGEIHIQDLQLDRGFWRVQRQQEGQLITGLSLIDSPTESAASSPPVIIIDQARMRRWQVLYSDEAVADPVQQVHIKAASLSQLNTQAEQPAQWQADLVWDKAKLSAKGQLWLSSMKINANLRVDYLPLQRVLQMARQPLPIDATLTARGQLSLVNGELMVDGQLSLADSQWQAADGGQLNVGAVAMQQARVQLPLSMPQALTVAGAGVSWQGLSWLDKQQGLQMGDGQLAGDWVYRGAEQVLDLQALSLQTQAIQLRTQDAEIRLGELAMTVQASRFPLAKPALSGQLKLGASELVQQADGRRLSIASSQLQNWTWQADTLQLQALQLQEVQLSQPEMSLASARLSRLDWHAGQLQLGRLTLDSLKASVQRNAQGEWELPAAGDSTSTQPAAKSLQWAVQGLELQGHNQIDLHDASIKPALRQQWQITRLQLGPINSLRPLNPTAIELQLKPDVYSQLSLQGTLQPLAERLNLELKGVLSGLPLPPLNGLLAKDLGHHFKGGQIDDEFSLAIKAGQLRMHNALTLIGLDVEVIEGSKGPPLSLAISLLEDRDGKIAIEVPIDGDLANPDFRVLAALNPIILKAVAGAAALAIQPAGSVLLVGSLLANEALKVSFTPAPFASQSSALGPKAKAALDALAGKLTDKPKLKLRLCGVAVISERLLDKQGKPAQTETQLLAIADARAQAVRSYLLAQGIEKARLKSCRPVFDQEAKAKPRVEISL